MLMQYIIDKTNINMPVTFMDGLTGIGWCIQYLISKHFLTSSMRHPSKDLQSERSKSGLTARCFSVKESVLVK